MDTSETSDDDDDDEDSGKKRLTQTELLDVIGTAVETAINAKAKTMGDKFTVALEESRLGTKKLQEYLMQREAVAQIENAKNEFADFDDYKEDIGKIMMTSTGTVRDAYLLAKARKAVTAPAKAETDSEKPTNLATRIQLAEKRRTDRLESNEQQPKGRVGFRQLLDAATKKVLAERGNQ